MTMMCYGCFVLKYRIAGKKNVLLATRDLLVHTQCKKQKNMHNYNYTERGQLL
jgi:hypothetical protein